MDLQEFLSWLDTEFSKYSVLAKSNPRSLNELVYVLRRTDRDFSINWETVGGFASIPTIREAYIPSRDLAMKVEVIGYDEDSFDGKTYCSITVKALDGPCANGVIYPSSMKCNGDDTAESKVFTIGGSVLANGNSDFCGLCGRVTEIRDGEDKKTENEGADIYCDFDKPGKDHMIAEIETRFSKLYQMPKRIDELPLDGVIMAAEMLEPVADALPDSMGKLYVLLYTYDGECDNKLSVLAVSTDRAILMRRMFDDLEDFEEKEGYKAVLSHTSEYDNRTSFTFEPAAVEESSFTLDYIIFEVPAYGSAKEGVAA